MYENIDGRASDISSYRSAKKNYCPECVLSVVCVKEMQVRREARETGQAFLYELGSTLFAFLEKDTRVAGPTL